MLKYLMKRILQAVPLLLLITILCFVLIDLAPYDAIDARITDKMTPAQIAQLKEEAGLNDPMPIQYLRWLGNLLKGDLGMSLINHTDIATDLKEKIPNTIKLVLPSYATAFLLAIALGLISGRYKDTWIDKIINSLASIGLAVPTFFVALLFIYYFGLKLDLFPVMGMHSLGEDSFEDFLHHLVMPYAVLVIGFLPDLVRYVRSSTITQFNQDYVTVQRAFGSGAGTILLRHVSKNVLLPMITKLGMALPMLVTGAVITETVFAWPGIGVYFTTAIRNLDYPVVMAVLVLSGSLVILGNLISDSLCATIDPRIRVGR